MLAPIIVNITSLHRETAAVIRDAEAADRPVFVTQHACVCAVLLPRPMYERLLRAAERAGEAAGDGGAAGGKGDGAMAAASCRRDPLADPLAVFGPLPNGTRFMTTHGYSVDAELATFLLEEGETVTPIVQDRSELDGEETEPHEESDDHVQPEAGGHAGVGEPMDW